MAAWLAWVIAAVLLSIGEIFTPGLFFLGPVALAAVAGAVAAALRTGTAALEGAHAVVLQRVDRDGGRVKIGGEEWSARAFMPDQVLEPGTPVEVVKIEGATALVLE